MVCLVLCACSTVGSDNYITVTGTGSTFERAKQDAFREAVQIKVGSAVVSERMSTVDSLVKDDIIVHSAGYVDDFKVLNTSIINGKYQVTVNVLVATSKISNFVLNTGKSEKIIEGERAAASVDTFMDQKANGDRLLDNVLAGYPRNALIVEQGNYSLSVDQFRRTVLSVPYLLKWNYDYLASLNEVLGRLEDGGFKSVSRVVISAKNPKDYLIGSTHSYRFNDVIRSEKVRASMLGGKEARIKLTINDRMLKPIYTSCTTPLFMQGYNKPLFSTGDANNTLFFGNESENGVLTVTIDPKITTMIGKAYTLELSIVSLNECDKY